VVSFWAVGSFEHATALVLAEAIVFVSHYFRGFTTEGVVSVGGTSGVVQIFLFFSFFFSFLYTFLIPFIC
jgi:hypothetical protein